MFALSHGSNSIRRPARGGGWIQAALLAAGVVASAYGSRQQSKAAKAAAKEGTKSAPWGPAQPHLKYGLSEARRLYDNRSYVPPPRRDLSHLFQTIPGMHLLKKSGLKMPSFVQGSYEHKPPQRGSGGGDATPRSLPMGRRPEQRPDDAARAFGGPIMEPERGFGPEDAWRRWNYATEFEDDALDDFLRRTDLMAGLGGAAQGGVPGRPSYLYY